MSSQHQRSSSQGPTVRPSVSPRSYVASELSKQGQASMDQNYISIPYYVWVGLGIIAGGFCSMLHLVHCTHNIFCASVVI